jgi:hypothetical protein
VRYFREVQEILLAGSRAKLKGGASKLTRFILEGSGADLEITEKVFTIRFDWNTARHRYFMDLAPGVVSALLDWCEVSKVVEPLAARFPADRVPRTGYLTTGILRADRDVWFLPGSPVQLSVRRAEPTSKLPVASALPTPIREPRRTVTLVRPHACPHCGRPSLSYRNLVGAWLCAACARSFPVGPIQLADVVEDERTAAG